MSIMAVIKDKQVAEREDPCLIYKAVKNQIEITNKGQKGLTLNEVPARTYEMLVRFRPTEAGREG